MALFAYALTNNRCEAIALDDPRATDAHRDAVEHLATLGWGSACRECDSGNRVNAYGFCRACANRARERFRRPEFVARFPVGYHEPEAMRLVDAWYDRFAGMVSQDPAPGGCIEWQGMVSRSGYGMFPAVGRAFLAHRLAYLLAGGDFGHPVIMHACDNPACVNPEHLVGGTHKDNMADMDAKGRRNTGSPRYAAHLRDRQSHPRARAISTPKGEFPSAALAAEAFGITRAAASQKAKTGWGGWHYL